MNSLKNLVIVGLLAVVAYGVYISMKKEKPASPPPGVAGWNSAAPQIDLGSNSAAPPADPNWNQNSTALPPHAASSGAMASSGSMAPPFSNPGTGFSASPPTGPDPTAPPATPPADPAFSGGSVPPASPPMMGGSAAPPQGPEPAGKFSTTLGSTMPETSAPPPTPPAPSGPPAGTKIRPNFVKFMNTARSKLAAGNWKDVHGVLTTWYDDPQLTPDESVQLTDLLDQIAGTAIYSRQSILDEAYLVQPGDTLQRIADSYKVPWQLLAKINGVRDPQNLRPNMPLKVVRGPFQAVIDLDSHKLTLMVNQLYAGHFRIGVGTDHPKLEGSYSVQAKMVDPDYYDPRSGMRIPAGDRSNPLGRRWINLGDQIGIHGTNDPNAIGTSQATGSICLGDRDIDDVYDILSIGSQVIIRR